MAKKEFYSRGKLLLTGEYAVVKGAKAIALPAKFGQSLVVSTGRGSDIRWKSKDKDGEEWFSAKISLFDFSPIKCSDEEIGERLAHLLVSAVRLNSEFLSTWKGIRVETRMEFPREWGLGSSSTLVANVAAWADVDPFELYQETFGGSGYDIACSLSDSPILFQVDENHIPQFSKVQLPDSVLEHMGFVYSGQKQNTQNALAYIDQNKMPPKMIQSISSISENLLSNAKLEDWIQSLQHHNDIISDYLQQSPFEENLIDFDGVIKPLGAWGGDFFLALSSQSRKEMEDYFKQKGFSDIIPASDLVIGQKVLTG
jgi:mevalonate kinase